MEVEQQIIKIKTKDKKIVEFKSKLADFSQVIRSIQEQQNDCEEIELQQFDHKTLELLKKYLQVVNYKHPNYKIAQPLPNNDLSKYLPQKDYQFIKELDFSQLKCVFDIAFFLDIEVLVELASAYVACMFKGKDLDEIYREWNISQEITPEIEEELKQKHFYVFEEQQPSLQQYNQ